MNLRCEAGARRPGGRAARGAAACVALAAAAGLAFSPPPAAAGAWTREAGSWFLKLGYDRLFTDRRFDAAGRRVDYVATEPGFDDEDEYRSQALRVYAEYGVTDEWTVVAAGGAEWIETEANGMRERNSGLADLNLQVKRRVLAAPVVVSLLGEGKIPTGYPADRAPALGTGKPDVGGRLAAGGSRGPLYVTGEIGYVVRGGARADEAPLALEAGYAIVPDVLAIATARGVTTARGPRAGAGRFDPALADARRLDLGLSLALGGESLDVVLGIERTVAGRNALAGSRLSFSIWREY